MSANLDWTPEKDALLLTLLAAGLSGRLAGIKIGTSRQSALYRARKLGFVHSKTPTKAPPSSKRSTPLPKQEAMAFDPLNIPYMELSAQHCREIVGKGEDGLALSCGHDKVPGSSYCAHHHAVNWMPASPRKTGSLFRFGGRAA